MKLQRMRRRWLASIALGTVAPLVLAQMGAPGGPGMRGQGRDAAWQGCKQEADGQKLPPGPERQKFMRQCVESKRGSGDAAKSEAARAKMADPQSGHLHSDPPRAPATPSGSGTI